ncbi:MAG: HD domain-containing protein [Desulfuromonadales bacterium]|nr:HD domain-containing protein [Desulfuromonadales bacterium]
MKKIFVEQIRERDVIESPFLVRDKTLAMAKNGKPYMTVKLIDRSGEIEGRIWDRVDEFDAVFDRDDFIVVHGKASTYLNKKQLVISNLRKISENEIDLVDFLPVSPRDNEEMRRELQTLVASLRDPSLRALAESFFNDAGLLRAFATAPAAKSMHHAYIGGLLEHSLAIAALVDLVAPRYPTLNRDLMILGALLHDIGKIGELSYVRSFDYTDEGKLIGHIVMGVEMIDERIRTFPDFPRGTAMLIKHLILSHHGQYDYGSPKRPKTLEAIVLNFLDDLDSKINGVSAHIDREAESASDWTSHHRLYDRYFYKGEKPAPPAIPVSVSPSLPVSVPAAPTTPDKQPKSFGNNLGEQLRSANLDLFNKES